MRVFISWSGTRSLAVAAALRKWLPEWVPGIEFFHSDDIRKGTNWHSALIEALRQCPMGLFCLTPEALQSPWLHFEAGALAQHGARPTLLTYLYGVDKVSGPLAHVKHTRFELTDTRKLVEDVAEIVRAGGAGAALERFDAQWPAFQAEVTRTTAVPLQELVADFATLFHGRKTFYEPFPECSDTRWDDRLRRIARTHGYLSQPEIAPVVESDGFLRQGHAALLAALDRYGMHVGSHLLERRPYDGLPKSAQRALEDARIVVIDLVATLQRQWPAPILAEAPAFETEFAQERRKDAILALQDRMQRGHVPVQTLRERRPEWALDRIAYYVACRAGLLGDVGVEELVSALDAEEALARYRQLVSGLQPLYYAAACLDERLPATTDARLSAVLLEGIERVERFIDAHPDRDSGGDIARRLASMRKKLAPGS
jgi:hypothetical protein